MTYKELELSLILLGFTKVGEWTSSFEIFDNAKITTVRFVHSKVSEFMCIHYEPDDLNRSFSRLNGKSYTALFKLAKVTVNDIQ